MQTLQLKRETCAWWMANSPTLALGEPGIETDTGNMKMGDGATTWNALAYDTVTFTEESILAGGGTTVNAHGCSATTVGTVSHPAIASTSVKTRRRRFTNTSAATAGAFAEARFTNLNCWGGNAAGVGGYRFEAQFGLDTLQSGMRVAIGMETAAAAATNVDPTTSTTNGKIQLAINANTGNWNLINNVAGTAPTVLGLGANYPVDTTTWFGVVFIVAPNSNTVYYRISNLTTSVLTTGTLTTNIPTAATYLAPKMWGTNNATAAAMAWSCGFMRLTPLGSP